MIDYVGRNGSYAIPSLYPRGREVSTELSIKLNSASSVLCIMAEFLFFFEV